MAWSSNDQYKVIADKIVCFDADLPIIAEGDITLRTGGVHSLTLTNEGFLIGSSGGYLKTPGLIAVEGVNLNLIGNNENVVLSSNADGVFITDDDSEANKVATLGDVGIETSYTVGGGTDGTQPTFTGDPLFTGSYIRTAGNLVHFQIQVDMDNITSFGTGQYFVSLPFNAKYGYSFRDGCYHDISAGTDYHVSGHVVAGSNTLKLNTSVKVGGSVEDSPFTSTNPVALNAEDNFHIAGTYIAQA